MIGHGLARAHLERELPTATLLFGPASVGKWTLANHLAEHHRVATVDRWQVPHGLTIDTVRLVMAYARRAPIGAFKLIQARLDASSRPALHALLKTLEEPPPKVKFLLVSASRTLPTIASRCTVFELGMLNTVELADIYIEQGYTRSRAIKAAAFAHGQVSQGYDAETAESHRNQASALAKALATGDRELFDNVFRSWDARSQQMTTVLLTECLTHRWSVFTPEMVHGLDHHRPRLLRMVAALGVFSSARPRLGVRAALEPFLNAR